MRRSEWAPLTRGEQESEAEHEACLKGLFSFRLRELPAEDSTKQ